MPMRPAGARSDVESPPPGDDVVRQAFGSLGIVEPSNVAPITAAR